MRSSTAGRRGDGRREAAAGPHPLLPRLEPRRLGGDVESFERVRATRIYEGIDVEYYGRNRQLEYDFLVAPGADPSQIVMAFTGVDCMSIDRGRRPAAARGRPTVRQHRPVAYQERRHERRTVEAAYLLLGGDRVVIALGDYDHERALVIDPVLAYSSYFGGNADDQVRALAVDANGYIYLTGVTQSTNFPRVNAAQNAKAGDANNNDVFVTKLSPSGTTVFFSTYLGGSGYENAAAETAGSIAVDGNGNVYVAGDTPSNDFPTTNGVFQPTFGAGTNSPADGFITKLSATGALVFSSYLGGTDVDHINGVAVASDGDVIVSGRTRSTALENFPLVNARDNTLSGNADAFVARIQSDGARSSSPPTSAARATSSRSIAAVTPSMGRATSTSRASPRRSTTRSPAASSARSGPTPPTMASSRS